MYTDVFFPIAYRNSCIQLVIKTKISKYCKFIYRMSMTTADELYVRL